MHSRFETNGSPPPEGFAPALQRALRAYMAKGLPSVELAAEIAGTSVRTLQRRLAQDGLSYSGLLERIRRDAAFRLVMDPRIKLIDIALELGYSDPAHFTRAFRRWAGMPPSRFRREHCGGPRVLVGVC